MCVCTLLDIVFVLHNAGESDKCIYNKKLTAYVNTNRRNFSENNEFVRSIAAEIFYLFHGNCATNERQRISHI